MEQDFRLASIELDPISLVPPTPQIDHERQVAIFDLVEENHFEPEGAGAGAFRLKLSMEDSRLVMDIDGGGYQRRHTLSLQPLRTVMRDYHLICESYYEAVLNASASQIEAVDMGRRGLHNEGADQLKARLEGKVRLDHETARRLFTLFCALVRRS